MARASKAKLARRNNAQKLNQTRKPYVEDVSDSEDHDYIPYSSCTNVDRICDETCVCTEDTDMDTDDSDIEDMDLDQEEAAKMGTEAEILRFSAILVEAQAVTVKAEREATESKPKWKHHYTGNAPRTIRHYALKRRKLASTGQKFIHQFFEKNSRTTEEDMGLNDTLNEGMGGKEQEDELVEEENQVEEGLQQIFPENEEFCRTGMMTHEKE
ncbi:hypothetical protein C0991_004944 [Blastosporella zonata]|nr:hypothetical protein C0991_004944 [Blastosporella zonata]